MGIIGLDTSGSGIGIPETMRERALAANALLHSREGAGSDFLGWVRLPADYDKEEFARIQKAAEKIRCQGTEINLALTDVMIPGPDGFELFPLMEERGSFMGSRRAWAAVPAQSGRIIKLLFS